MNSCLRFSGCVITGVTRYGGDIATIKNVSSYFDCNKLCSENEDCFIWTYIEGACYVKNENTFWVRNQNVVGGYKDCNSDKRTGQLLIYFCHHTNCESGSMVGIYICNGF